MFKFFILLLFPLSIYLSELHAQKLTNVQQDYILEQIKNENFHYEIYTIKLMDNGYLFMGTNQGLFYFDGTSIKPSHINHFGKNKDIIGLIRVSSNCLLGLPYWGKLLRISNEKKFCDIQQPEYSNSNYKITSAYLCNDSIVNLLCTDYFNSGRLLRYNVRSNKLNLSKQDYHYKQYYLDFLFPSEKINEQHGLYSILKKKFELNNEKQIGIISNEYLALNSEIYKKTNAGPILIEDFKRYHIEGRILSLFKKNDSLYYFSVVGRNHGVYKMENRKLECLYDQDDVTGIQIDKNNFLYFSTIHNGLYRINLNNPNAKQYRLHETVVIRNIQYYPDTKQTLLADETGNVYDLNLQHKSLSRLVTNKQNKVTNTLFLPNDPDHFSDGRFLYNLRKTKIISHHREGLKVIHLLKHKDTFYNIGNNYIWKVQQPTFTNKFELIRADKYINSVLVAENDTILIATDKGLLYYANHKIAHYSSNSALDQETILHLTKERETYFYTTPNSIFFENRKSRELNRIHHVNTTHAISCIPYQNTMLYIHESGFIKYDKHGRTLDKFEIPNYNIDIRCIGAYLTEDTINLYNHNSIYSIPLDTLNNQFSTHTLIIRNLSYGKDTLLFPGDQIKLTHLNNSALDIQIDLFYTPNTKIEAELFIESSQESRPIMVSNNRLLLDNLNPGNYSLKLYIDDTRLKTLAISISSPWYFSIWAKGIVALSILGILYFIILSVLNRRNQKKLIAILQQNHLLQLETQSKLNQLKPHFIFNALMPLQHYIVTSDKKNGLDYLKKLSVMLRQVMHLTRKDINSVADELKFLDLYLHIQQIEKSHQFTYTIQSTIDKSELRQLNIPALMLQPLVENSIVHGFSDRQHGQLTLRFDLNSNHRYVIVTIVDNGEGFNDALLDKTTTNALNIIQERIRLLNNIYPETNLTFLKTELEFHQKITLPILRIS